MTEEARFTERWAHEIEDFSSHCGPSVVAAALGISRGEAADKLLEQGVEADHKRGYTSIYAIGKILDRSVESTAINHIGAAGSHTHVKFTDRYPTVNQWLWEHKTSIAIIRAANHFMYVGFGLVLEDNGYEPRKGRVTHVVFLDGRPST